ncbi:mechanosensitive ion channel family protein [Sandarakinorhabdus rubra]|uniref:mechanosensitive ion channel family protein n=1 Tax=Sandarakinorhabdus rubra TaxID=2672568 RepID=UPI0013DA9D49|nr:mechanosensitive ion channel domain-containing protein [Sandarakinorhabdus rubra]
MLEFDLDKALAQPLLKLGQFSVTLEKLIAAGIILGLAALAVWGIRFITSRSQARVAEGQAATIYVAGQVARYVVVLAAVAGVISALGVDLSALSLFAGALGVGVGLGLQDVVKNFVYGLILLFDGSMEVGDFVELQDGTSGLVVAIGPRATTLRTNDHVDVLVPNGLMLGGKLTNWTRDRTPRRVHVPFTVAYGSDKDKVRAAALEAARAVPFTRPDEGDRRTQVWLTGFGDSALKFELVVWPALEAVKRPGGMMAAYCWALDDAMRRHGIEIPFPQQDLRIRSWFGHEGEAGLAAAAGRPIAPATAPSPSPTAPNDAAEDVGRGEGD